MDSRGESCFSRYCRNASPTRLLLYGVVAIAAVVIVILLFTLLPSKSGDGPSVGHQVLKFVPLVDGYNGLPAQLMNKLNGALSKFPFEKNLADDKSLSWSKTDLPRLRDGMVNTQVWSVKVACESQYKDAAAKTLQQVDLMRRLILHYKDEMKLITTAEDITNNFNYDHKVGSMIAIDGGHSIDNKLAALRMYYSLGVRCMALTSECNNTWAASLNNKVARFMLSEFGKVVIKEMNRLGMIIDLGQAQKETQLAVLDETQAPVIFTKLGVKSLAAYEGNIEDEVLEKVKKNNGLVIITFDGHSLKDDKDSAAVATLKNVIAHINYVRQMVGVDNVGIGAGFNSDGSAQTSGLEDSSKYPALFDRLAQPEKGETKWTPDELKKLAGLNFVRVLQAVEQVSASKVAENPNESLINPNDIPTDKRSCYTAN